ncbi:hypothetical protein [Candidatus Aciduliprofundum boonei]|uniref:Uncharacterized protein n=1 Tax=Aciduliprofundum boonei (strain DSM 19572 / T469) TaxID=439481 RepID=B5IFT0_ACIB4|nr:hypothetical protein [Candidatus Aciduliprofundum boonei]ADD09015.1 hypothetical protein Aboo_1206 [Aciduliprofundum boonei T469]EDY34915.1 hypothetical protein ABOONEI_1181 [Aciduliprofundum boonei T469]HII55507.1 hypothetical protein [Candidatus Aciduliprofundum boonei]
MHELKRFQIKRIIEEAMRITNDITLREDVKLEDIYKIAEAVKGERLTKREKLMIAGIVKRHYSTYRELEDNELKVVVMV